MTNLLGSDHLTEEWVAFNLSGFDADTYIHDSGPNTFCHRVDLSGVRGRCYLSPSMLWLEDRREASILRLRGTLPQRDRAPLTVQLAEVEWDKSVVAERLKEWRREKALDHFAVARHRDFIRVEAGTSIDGRKQLLTDLISFAKNIGWWSEIRCGKNKNGQWSFIYRLRHELASRYIGGR